MACALYRLRIIGRPSSRLRKAPIWGYVSDKCFLSASWYVESSEGHAVNCAQRNKCEAVITHARQCDVQAKGEDGQEGWGASETRMHEGAFYGPR
jgi:hypothetical protein